MERARVTYIDETVKKDSLLVYALNFFSIWEVGTRAGVVVREKT